MRVANDLLDGFASLIAGVSTSNEFDIKHLPIVSLTAAIASAVPANKTFAAAAVNVTDNTATITAHGFATGLKVQVSNPGTLPTGLAAVTDYYLIVVDANTVKFASSQANALAGTAIDLTVAGAGTNTVEVDTDIAGTIKLQFTNDPAEGLATLLWLDVPDSSNNITAAANFGWNYPSLGYRALRAVVTITSGQVTAAVRINAKGA